MHFLIDANLPRRTADVICKHGHHPMDVRDIGLRHASDAQIAAHAREHGYVILTRDFDFADVRNYPPRDYAGIVVLEAPHEWAAEAVSNLVDRMFAEAGLVESLSGRLVIVAPQRIRIRRSS
jgi:predicted nuclease of predicted toxin-antitoxin system